MPALMLSPRWPLSMQVWTDETTPATDASSAVRGAIGLARSQVLSAPPRAARRSFCDAIRQARSQQLPALAAEARQGLGQLLVAQGDHRAGMQALASARLGFQALAQHDAASDVSRDLADTCLHLGRWTEAQTHLRGLINHLQGRSDAAALPWLWLRLSEAQTAAGQPATALSTLAWAQVLFMQRGQASGWVQAELACLAITLADPQAPAQAAQIAAQARALQARLARAGASPAAPRAAPHQSAGTDCQATDGTALLQARWLQSRACRLSGALSTALALLPRLCGPQALAEAPALHALAWVEAGLAYQAQGDLAAASGALDQAITRLDDLHWALPQGPATPTIGPAVADALLQACAARLALAAGHASPEQALCWLHRHRVRQLLPCLGGADILRLADPEQRAQLQDWRVRHQWLQRALRRARQDGQPCPAGCTPAALQQVERSLLCRTRQLRRARWPGASALLEGDTALDITALRRHFRQGRALVAYGEVQGQVLAMVVAQGAVHRVLLPTRVADLTAALQRLRLQLLAHGQARDAACPMADARQLAHCTGLLQAIHQQIWAPLDTVLDGASDLVVVPSQVLQSLPFAALHDGSRWLDAQCRLRQAATIDLAMVRGSGPNRARGAAAGGTMRSSAPRNRGALTAALRAARPMHLACTVQWRADSPATSGWRLGDGSLATPADLAHVCAAAPLVWLDADSACVPGQLPGDARLALPLALQRAGVEEVIDSLWPLPAAAAAALQAALHAATGAGACCTATALQQARAAVRARHPHPAVWAAPCLLGGQPVQAA